MKKSLKFEPFKIIKDKIYIVFGILESQYTMYYVLYIFIIK